ncbi:MAG TPA: hypothetical protein VFP61_07550 [Acidimicrobiales bacterium]|nr:hypothetical protein [Acidimicrobiales bacterium]
MLALIVGSVLTVAFGIPTAYLTVAQIHDRRERRARIHQLDAEAAERAEWETHKRELLEYLQHQLRPKNGRTLAQTVETADERMQEIQVQIERNSRRLDLISTDMMTVAVALGHHLKMADVARVELGLPPEEPVTLPFELLAELQRIDRNDPDARYD